MTTLSLGILGTGHLASYTVAGVRNAGDNRSISLSPRNNRIAKEIAQTYNCRISDSNQSVINDSEIILLAVRPDDLDGLLSELQFKPDQLIISAIAGVTIEQLKIYSNLTYNTIVRTLPSVSAEVNSGPVPLFPDNKDAHELLTSLGTIFVLDKESFFDIATVHACMHGWIYFLLDQLVRWTADQGLSEQQAEQMVKLTVQGAIDFSNHRHDALVEIGNSIATPGTYTLAGLEKLRSGQSLQDWSEAMQLVLNKLKQD